jgi:excisionase family DNA binding protein
MKDLLTSTQVAELLGVGASSVKRWADSGRLPCVRTPGGHRRFLRPEVERALAPGALGMIPLRAVEDQATRWYDLLASGTGPFELRMALASDFERQGAWWRVAEGIALALTEVGQRWRRGLLTVTEEHTASESLSRAIARAAESQMVPEDAPVCLLMAPPGEEHTLGLGLAELIARAQGWNTRWVGRAAPLEEIEALMDTDQVQMVTVAALEGLTEVETLGAVARRLVAASERSGAAVVLAGSAAWPEPPFGSRVRRARNFEHFAEALRGARAA